ncbi:MAG: hypothetical protein ABW047_08975 [Nitrospiraceae bacterium]
MKSLIIMIIAMSLSLMVVTSPPNSAPDAAESNTQQTGYWVNPDGTRGMVENSVKPSVHHKNSYSWRNPDGVLGSDRTDRGESPATNYSWANPDGTQARISTIQARSTGSN